MTADVGECRRCGAFTGEWRTPPRIDYGRPAGKSISLGRADATSLSRRLEGCAVSGEPFKGQSRSRIAALYRNVASQFGGIDERLSACVPLER